MSEYSLEEFDREKSKVVRYIVYKKRTEKEIRTKFYGKIEENMLEDILQYLKENKYIDDKQYIVKAVNEFQILNNLSIKEIKYKLQTKGINRYDLKDYLSENEDELLEYEKKSAEKILIKKKNIMTQDDIKNYLRKKGYKEESIKSAFEQI